MTKEKSFIQTHGVALAMLLGTMLVQIGGYIAGDARLKEDVKQLISDMISMKEFRASYTARIETLEKTRWVK